MTHLDAGRRRLRPHPRRSRFPPARRCGRGLLLRSRSPRRRPPPPLRVHGARPRYGFAGARRRRDPSHGLVRGARAHDRARIPDRHPPGLRTMLHIIFWEPEIPGNTGAAIRCPPAPDQCCTWSSPWASTWTTRSCAERASTTTTSRTSWCTTAWTTPSPRFQGRVWALTGHATSMYLRRRLCRDGDGLLFRRESVGLSEKAMNHPRVRERVRIQMRERGAFAELGQLCINRPVRGVASAGFPGGV